MLAVIGGSGLTQLANLEVRRRKLARTPYAAETLRHQARVLPQLAPRLPAAIPRPELVSDEPVGMAYRRLAGVPCDAAPAGPTRWIGYGAPSSGRGRWFLSPRRRWPAACPRS